MKNVNRYFSVFALVAALLFAACGEQPETTIRLTSSERIRIDSLSKKQIDSLAPIADSICEANQAQMVEQALDSIIELRKAEEQTLRERIKRKQ